MSRIITQVAHLVEQVENYLRRIVFCPDLAFAPFFLFGKSLYHVKRQFRELPLQIRELADRF